MPLSEVYNEDSLQALKNMPDKSVDWIITDPPFGNCNDENFEKKGKRFGARFDKFKQIERTGGTRAEKYGKKIVSWDIAPPQEHFDEIFRVSKNQIIFGGNYFCLPPTRCFIIYEKIGISENFTMAMCEYAWCSLNANAKVVKVRPQGQKGRFHPTSKPRELWDWILRHYVKQGETVLDPFMGEGNIRLSCYDAGIDFIGYELDEEYFKKYCEKFEDYISQASLF